MKDRCPHRDCNMVMDLDTDTMIRNGMFEDEATGDFKCQYCERPIYWKAFASIEHSFETDPDFL